MSRHDVVPINCRDIQAKTQPDSSKILSIIVPTSEQNQHGPTVVTMFRNEHTYTGASPGFGRGGPRIFFFQIWNFACREATAAHGEAMRIARGVWGHVPPRKFFKTVQFGAF